MKKLFTFLFFVSFLTNFGQITTSVNPTVAQMQALLQGSGVVVSGLTITCPLGAYATFNNGAAALGGSLNTGILLTTGTASNVAGPPTGFNSLDNSSAGGAGSALGNTLSGGTTFDGCYINFLITPSCATLSVNYVFASEEYPEFATGTINDVFGFVLSGPNPSGGNYNQLNTATLPVTTTTTNVVSIQNVNNGSTNTGPCVNCAYYIDSPPGLVYDGATTVLTASASVVPCQTYTMTIGVWDDSDGIYDSGVFLDVNGLTCANQPVLTTIATPSVICAPQPITLTATGGAATGTYTWSAPPSGGLSTTTGSVITANPTSATTYTLKYSDINTCPGFPVTTTVSIAFAPTPSVSVSQNPAGALCSGQSATLTSSGGSGTYTWTPSTFLNTTTGSSVIVTPTVNTSYTILSGSGTCTVSAVTSVSVTSAPSISVTPSNTTICNGQSTTLNVLGSTGPFGWTASVGANPAATGTVVVSPTTTTTYSVLSGSGTCTAQAVASVSVSPTLTLTVTPSNTLICSGTGVSLTGGGAINYTWLPSLSISPSISVTPSSTTTYTLLGSNGVCSNSTTATVSVTTVSTSLTASSNTYCVGGASVTLTASGATTYSWSPNVGLSSSSGAVVSASPSVTTTYTVDGYIGSCVSSQTVTITIPAITSLSATATSTLICSGSTSTLIASGASTYTWLPVGTSTSTLSVSPASLTSYTVMGQTAAGCATNPATISVNVVAPITLTVTPASTVICSGGTGTSLTASGATNYTWSPGSITTPILSANPASTTTYTLTGAVGSCTNSATATVSVSTVVTGITASSLIYCLGGAPVTLTGTGATTYAWSPGLSAATGNTVTAMPSVTTVYTATGTTGSCSSTQTISITVPPTSTVMVTSTNTLICASGVGTTLNASGASTYTWMPGSIISNTINANPLTTTTYTALGQTAAGCIAVPGVITVSVIPAVNPTITASSATVCLTKTVSISATPTGAGLSYTWAPASSIMGASNTATIVAKPTTTATVIYTLTLSNGLCTTTNTVMLQVFDCVPPVGDFTTLTNDSICTKGCVTFSSTVTGTGPISYQWFFPGGTPPTSNQSNPEVCYFAQGSYSVGLVVLNPYGTDTIIKSNFISVTDTPAVVKAFGDTLILVGQTAPIYATGATSYQWYPNHAIACNTCSNTIAQPTVTTQYIVTGSNSIYCKRTDTIVVRVDFICGDFFIPNVFSPNDDGLNDFVNVHGFCINTFNLQIFSRWGEKVFETTSKSDSWDGSFRGKKMDTGVFVYKVDGTTIDGKTFSMKGNITLLR